MYIKGVTERFGFDALESRKFKQLVKNKATGTSHGMFIYSPHWLFTLLGDMLLSVFYILIGVGLSALLVSTNWAMREPYYVERASGLAPRFFLYPCRNPIKSVNVLYGATRRHNFRCGAECVLYKIGVAYTFNNHK